MYLLLAWSLSGNSLSPLSFRREKHHCVCLYALLSIKLSGFLLTLSVKVGKLRLATPCLVSSFDNFTFQSIKKFIFFKRFFILYIQYSIYLFHIQYCYNIMLYEEIVFLNKYCKNKLRILYHILYQKKSKNTFSQQYSSKFIFFFSRFLENARFSSTQWIWRNTASWKFSKRISAA